MTYRVNRVNGVNGMNRPGLWLARLLMAAAPCSGAWAAGPAPAGSAPAAAASTGGLPGMPPVVDARNLYSEVATG